MGKHAWWRHKPPEVPTPIKYTPSCRQDQRLSTEGKIVSKYWNISKIRRGVLPPTPPPPQIHPNLVPRWGVWICMYFRGLNCKIRYTSTTLKELIRKSLCLPIFRNITERQNAWDKRGFLCWQQDAVHAVRKRLAKVPSLYVWGRIKERNISISEYLGGNIKNCASEKPEFNF